jgi:hypothetical protein
MMAEESLLLMKGRHTGHQVIPGTIAEPAETAPDAHGGDPAQDLNRLTNEQTEGGVRSGKLHLLNYLLPKSSGFAHCRT